MNLCQKLHLNCSRVDFCACVVSESQRLPSFSIVKTQRRALLRTRSMIHDIAWILLKTINVCSLSIYIVHGCRSLFINLDDFNTFLLVY